MSTLIVKRWMSMLAVMRKTKMTFREIKKRSSKKKTKIKMTQSRMISSIGREPKVCAKLSSNRSSLANVMTV